MKSSERPLSPHLQIYKPQLTSILSIMHRITGAALFVGCFMLVWWVVALAMGPEAHALFMAFVHSWLGMLFLVGWTFSFYYHFANGLRHLYWDLGRGYDLSTTYKTGWFVLGTSLVLTLVTLSFFLLDGAL
jgi:succinate dehydrogenase / fumarate reductase cytochrome b subunit